MTTRVLVTYGSKRGSTAEIAMQIADTLRAEGFPVDCFRANHVSDVRPYDAVIVGGALYSFHWVREARRFVRRNAQVLRERPVWMFSSGPLDDSAEHTAIAPVRGVRALMHGIAARDHVTFGGRLAAEAKGFPAAAMAKQHAGDWRDWNRIKQWAHGIAAALAATPQPVRPAPALPARWPLAALCFAVGIAMLVGGIAVPAPVMMFVGFVNLVAGTLVARDAPSANGAALFAGAALLVAVVTDVARLHAVEPLHLVYLLAAIAIFGEALRRRAKLRRVMWTPA